MVSRQVIASIRKIWPDSEYDLLRLCLVRILPFRTFLPVRLLRCHPF